MISIKNIKKYFGNNVAVDGLSFDISDGEIVGLLGPNGAGKSTTMRILTGYLSPDFGSAVINGIDVLENPIEAQKMIGYLPENNPLYQDMLVSDFLDLSCELKKLENIKKKEALDFAVQSVNIQDIYYRPIKELSKGYKQRVGIAAALLNKPKVLIMDEPTEGLDPNQRAEIRKLIKDLSSNHTVLISTHVMQEVEAICTRMIIINKGKKVADGSVEELSHSNSTDKILFVTLEGNNVENELKSLPEVKKFEILNRDGNKLSTKIITDSNKSIESGISKLIVDHNWIIWQLKEEKIQLEEVFKELTR